MPPLNGSGGVTQPTASLYPATANTLIEAAKANNSIADIYTILASALYKDGQQTATQRIPFAAGISADTIAEITAAAGVTIDGVLLKDALVGIGYGGTGQSTAQLAVNALSAVAAATNEHVLTKDTGTGNAVFKAAAGGLAAASQADQETATSTAVAVTPGRQQFHPSAAKAWAKFDVTGTVQASYNVASVTDNAAGTWTVVYTTAFSSANYAAHCTPYATNDCFGLIYNSGNGQRAQDCNVAVVNSTSNGLTDPTNVMFAAYGDQA